MPRPSAPLTVEATRGFAPESSHAVHAVVMDGSEKALAVYGDAARLVFPRSSIKPLQAIALVRSGAADAFGFSDAEIALACASHSGEEMHVTRVAKLLARLGLDETALECGAHAPYAAPQDKPCILCNNCSGKHAGMLALSLFLKAPARGYTDPRHPAQQAILAELSKLCGEKLTPAVCGVDGCSAPNPAMSLGDIARGFARFMHDDTFPRIFGAATGHPELVGGTGRLDTVLMQAAQGKILSKTGAEGVYIAVIPGRDTVIALKAEDGAQRASQAALFALLEKHGLADAGTLEAIRPLALPALKNWRGIETGCVRLKPVAGEA